MLRIITRSIRHKFTLVVLTATLAALIVTGIAMVIYDLRIYERTGFSDLAAQGEILGRASTPALDFEDPTAASEYLLLLKAKPEISAAAVYTAKGKLFASYTRRDLDLLVPILPGAEGIRIDGKDIVLFKRIVKNNEILGTVYIKADFELRQRLIDYLGIFAAVTLLSLIVALSLSTWLQGVFIRPILATSDVARQVVETRDYSLRVSKTTTDEVGDLVDAFNDMVAEVGRRSEALEASNLTLEHEMVERKQAEQRIRTQLGHLRLLDQITRSIDERQDLQSIFQVVVRVLEDSLPMDFGCVCLLDPAANTLRVTCVGVKSEILARELAKGELASIDVGENGLSRCIQGQLVYEPDIRETRFPFPARLARGGLVSVVMAPLRSESKVFGVLVAARRTAQTFSSDECEFLRQLSEHVALAAHQAQLYSALQQAYDDLRQTQQAVMQQERLRVLGQMASGIAHDINNALSPVSLYTESLLETERNLSDRGRGHLETIRRAVEDVAHTVARMREFYRPREVQIELAPVQLNLIVQQVVDLTRARWNDMPQQRGVVTRASTELAPGLPQIMGVESEIREALTNLVFNAVDAMPAGGTLTLRTRRTDADSHREAMVVVEITDTGVGMDEETRRRCLEPFFTTKGERGTGLGLAMVFGIVQRHSAEIEIDSTPDTGTTVRLVFTVPVAMANVPGDPVALKVPPHLRLLLVDDDPVLLQSMRDTLEFDGHVIVIANSGREGIEVFRAAHGTNEPFAAVVTDLGMPYVDGREVASTVKQISPATPVILLTGWGQRLIAEGDIPPHVDLVLPKPPKLQALRQAFAQLCQPRPTKHA